jgi:molecular chaperone DnaK (HSP70)
LSKEDIDRMVDEAERYKNEDDELKARIDAKNRMEEQIYQLKNTNSGTDNKVDAETKQKINDIIKEYEEWHTNNPGASKDTYEEKSKEMLDSVSKITVNKSTEPDLKKA